MCVGGCWLLHLWNRFEDSCHFREYLNCSVWSQSGIFQTGNKKGCKCASSSERRKFSRAWSCEEELGLPLTTVILEASVVHLAPVSTSHKLIDFLVPRVQMIKKMDSKSHLVLEYHQIFTWTWVQSPAAEILAKRKESKSYIPWLKMGL